MTGTPIDDDLGPDLDDAGLESLRNAFVEGFNARDLDAILTLVAPDVETPDVAGDGRDVLAEELQAIWERSPAAVVTNATIADTPAAMAWLPDERGAWLRAAVVTFDAEGGLLTVVEMPDDADALHTALADDPSGDPIADELDWSEWDRGEPSGGEDGDWLDRVRPRQPR